MLSFARVSTCVRMLLFAMHLVPGKSSLRRTLPLEWEVVHNLGSLCTVRFLVGCGIFLIYVFGGSGCFG